MDTINVLIVDDSALMRNLIGRIVEATPGLAIADKAMNGKFALDKIPRCDPDVIVLDVEMPEMDGLQFLRERRHLGIEIPVIMLSGIAEKGAAVTMQCLELGASDFITKPGISPAEGGLQSVAARLSELLFSYGGQHARRRGKRVQDFIPASDAVAAAAIPSVPKAPSHSLDFSSPLFHTAKKEAATITPIRGEGRIEIIAIGISTGGPNALREVFAAIKPGIPQPIAVVQHMPVGFTTEFANSLNNICPLTVTEAQDGEILRGAHVYIAPGNSHIYVAHEDGSAVIKLSDAPLRNGHRPSADVLFESVAREFQNRALGIIMTGMGNDGAKELAEMRRQGARTLGQDETSSIVYGMPRVAWELGGVQRQVSLSKMADEISTLAFTYK
ncbi:MAG: chemotaxis response regulator protein-glutamate methylesterase [Treponemataceae bacterium]|nr:MAG: chemotaxis response regulator protein-glutamate methylesterase [Treponemataceae bacterium]